MTARQYAYSVKDIAEFCCRTGDYRYSDTPTPTAQQGQDIHRFLQNQSEKSSNTYRAEAPAKHIIQRNHDSGNYDLIIRGRADAYWLENQSIHIEEIKTTFYDKNDLPSAIVLVHLAQAKLYAYLLSKEHPGPLSDRIVISLTYWHLGIENYYQLVTETNHYELSQFFEDTVNTFTQWLDKVHEHRQRRNQYIADLAFPFDTYREGQKTVAAACYKSATEKNTTFVHAATGIGKSLSTLFGTLKAIPDTKLDQVWYLTAKTSGKSAINQALALLYKQGPHLKVLHLFNRHTTCFCTPSEFETQNSNDICNWERDFYDQKPVALEELFQHNLITLDVLQEVAKKHCLCPHHLAQEVLPWVDIVVADFNFVFSFTARNSNYLERKGKNCALLIDETHNLVARARDLYQAELDTKDLQQIKTATAPNRKIASSISTLTKLIKALPKESVELPNKFFDHIEYLRKELTEWQQQANLLFQPEEISDIRMTLSQWMRISKYLEPKLGAENGQPFSLVKTKNKISLLNNNPAPVTDDLASYFNNRVYFSGSLLPLTYFTSQLSTEPKGSLKQLVAHSPFPENRLNLALGNLNLNYQNREASIDYALSYIEALWNAKQGLYLICASSYQYLEVIQRSLEDQLDVPLLFQERFETTEDKDQFSHSLSNMTKGIAGIVMGGSFGEGVEWPPGILKGVIILGSGMPSPSSKQDRLQQYFDHNDNLSSGHSMGFEYTYLYPAINRVIQTVGRIQRQNADAGIALLLDKRFRKVQYRQLFPPNWRPIEVNTPVEVTQVAQQFWETVD